MFHEPRFWTGLAFVIFFAIFGRTLWSAMTKTLDARAQRVRTDLDEASRLRREAEQMLEHATREREKTLEDVKELMARSEAEASALAERARLEAQAANERYEAQTRDRIEAAEQAALRTVRERATAIAIAAARDVVAAHLANHPDVAAKIIDDHLATLSSSLHQAAA